MAPHSENLAGRALRIVIQAALLAILGFAVPYFQGFRFFDTKVLCAYGLLATLLAAPRLTERLQLGQPLLRESLVSAFLSWGLTILAATCGLLTVNLSRQISPWVFPRYESLFAIAVLSLVLALLACTLIAVLVAYTGGTRVGQYVVRIGLLALLFGFVAIERSGSGFLEPFFDPEGLRLGLILAMAVGAPLILAGLWLARRRIARKAG